ncbi:phage tail protein I [Pseudomonas sp. GD03860]|uniref:phage tail protein I n=1 Tax=Pseudomonas TaxID=286 RepID=UPI0023648A2A|nr:MULTISPECIES: phage tail protein I [Pseudomonas]MDD2059061.1 phage tail protein I [Pseudomonas putida]MDH0639362.1 phage tail protein I [Pseudomonas sp. GD03860]
MSLLPINSTRLERILAAACDFGIDPDVIRGIADSTRCPPDFLPWLAWAMKVEGWEAAETDEQQRALIREAIPVHKTKGTVGAIRRVLSAVKVNAEFKDWHQIPDGVPYTFQLTAWANQNREGEGSIISPLLGARLRALVDATKNERSHYEFRLGAQFDGGIRLGNSTRGRTLQRRYVDAQAVPVDPANQVLQVASATRSLSVSRVFAEAQGVSINAESGVQVASASRTRVIVRATMEAVL